MPTVTELKSMGAAARLIWRGAGRHYPGYLLGGGDQPPVGVDWISRRCGCPTCPYCHSFPTFSTALERRRQSEQCPYVQYVAWLHYASLSDEARQVADYRPTEADLAARPGDVEADSAQEQLKVVLACIRFVASGFAARLFNKTVYHELYQHFGFIAHYDQHGFYAEYFTSLQGQREFIREVSGKAGWWSNSADGPYATARAIQHWTTQAERAGLLFHLPTAFAPTANCSTTAQLSFNLAT